MKTVKKFVEYCRYSLGQDKLWSREVFNLLQGRRIPGDYALRMDLIAYRKNNPKQIIDSLYCTLKDLVENSAIISREVFKKLNIE